MSGNKHFSLRRHTCDQEISRRDLKMQRTYKRNTAYVEKITNSDTCNNMGNLEPSQNISENI